VISNRSVTSKRQHQVSPTQLSLSLLLCQLYTSTTSATARKARRNESEKSVRGRTLLHVKHRTGIIIVPRPTSSSRTQLPHDCCFFFLLFFSPLFPLFFLLFGYSCSRLTKDDLQDSSSWSSSPLLLLRDIHSKLLSTLPSSNPTFLLLPPLLKKVMSL
jgi:hypothetical protein